MAPADEIIEDYASSLEWLHTNDRYAINNFTVIAKENTEHSEAISGVLMDHIAKVSSLCLRDH
jgi:pre-mRNA cleavage complex 2 protein Pcf11